MDKVAYFFAGMWLGATLYASIVLWIMRNNKTKKDMNNE